MGIKKILEEQGDNIEKGLIAALLGSVFISLFVEEFSQVQNRILITLQVLLILYYMLLNQNKLYLLLWVGFLAGVLSYFVSDHLPNLVYFALNTASFVIFGLIILYRTFRLSLQNKSFELLSFIMGFMLVLQAGLPFFKGEEELFTFYSFALSFAIGFIVYNDNLWHRFSRDEKKVIIYILIVSLALVIQSSGRYINL